MFNEAVGLGAKAEGYLENIIVHALDDLGGCRISSKEKTMEYQRAVYTL